jgi:TetR/AcrR family transcriptional repressor of bet genes
MPKQVDHDGRRERIAQAAARQIGALGIDGVTMRDIAAEAGCTTGMITHYFDTKDDVLLSALMLLNEGIFERLYEHKVTDFDSFLATLEEALPIDDERLVAERVWVSFWGRAFGSDELTQQHRDVYESWHRFLVEALEELRRRDLVNDDADTDELARHLMAAIDGIGIQVTLDPRAWPAKRQRECLEAHARLLLQGST